MRLIYLSQIGAPDLRFSLEGQPPKVRKERTMASTRTWRRTARPLTVSGDVHLDVTVPSWEVELVARELASIADEVDSEAERVKGRRQRHAAG